MNANTLGARSTPTKPGYNLNGTTPASLALAQHKLLDALETAREALIETQPHGRDYQTLRDGGFYYSAARDEHLDRLRALEALIQDARDLRDDALEHAPGGTISGLDT